MSSGYNLTSISSGRLSDPTFISSGRPSNPAFISSGRLSNTYTGTIVPALVAAFR